MRTVGCQMPVHVLSVLIEVALRKVKCAADVRLRTARFVRVGQACPVAVQPAPRVGREAAEVLKGAFSDLMIETEFDTIILALRLRGERVTARCQDLVRGSPKSWVADDVDFVLFGIKSSDVFNSAYQVLVSVTDRSDHVLAEAMLARRCKFTRENRLNRGIDAIKLTLSIDWNGAVVYVNDQRSESGWVGF